MQGFFQFLQQNPFLLLFFVVGMGGAWLVAVVSEHVDQGQWIANLRDIVDLTDVLQGLIKGVFFGFLVALVGCYQGFNATGGGRGVGMGTTRAVVIASGNGRMAAAASSRPG